MSEPAVPPRASRRTAARDSAVLFVGTAVNGVLAYVFFAMATRGLGAVEAAPVAVLWTYWGLTAAAVSFPIQHWTISMLETSGDARVRALLPRIAGVVLCVSVLGGLGSFVVRERLFTTADPVFPLAVFVITIASALAGLVRGGLSGRRRFAATAVSLAGENAARVLGGAVVLAVGGGAVAFGVVLALGAFVNLSWPSSLRYRGGAAAARGDGDRHDAGGVLRGVAVASLLAQILLVGGPAVASVLGAAPDTVTVLFATLALFRAPYLIAVGVSNRATGAMAASVVSGGAAAARRIEASVAVSSVVAAGVAAAGAWVVGPGAVALVFGPSSSPTAAVSAVVAAGSVLAIGNLVLSMLAIVNEGAGRLRRSWGLAMAVATAVVILGQSASPAALVATAFLVGEATALAAYVVGGWIRGDQENAR